MQEKRQQGVESKQIISSKGTKKPSSKRRLLISFIIIGIVALLIASTYLIITKITSNNYTSGEEALTNQGFGGKIIALSKTSITVQDEEGREQTFKIGRNTPVYIGLASTEGALSDLKLGSRVDIGYSTINNEAQGVWLWKD